MSTSPNRSGFRAGFDPKLPGSVAPRRRKIRLRAKRDIVTEARTRRCWTFVLILGIAFSGGLIAAIATARIRPEPYRGVYRQAAIEVVATQSGRITALNRDQGVLVRPGESIATIACSTAQESLAELERREQELKLALEAARDRAAMELALQNERIEDERLETRLRYADLLRERLNVQTRKQALEHKTRESSAIVATAGRSQASGLPATDRMSLRLEIAEAINHGDVLQTQIQLCEDRLSKLDTLQSSLANTIEGSFGVARLKAELASIAARRKAASTGESAVEITSPAYGRIGVWRSEVGDQIIAGQTLVEIFDAERPFVFLRVPVSELLELTVGRKVRVEFAGISTKKALAGVVEEIRSEAELDADSARAPGASEAIVRIAPTGRLWPTPPPGTTARVYLK